MRHPIIKITGYGFIVVITLGLIATVVLAALTGHPFYGTNYKGLPLGTYSTLAVLVIAAGLGIAWLCKLFLQQFQRNRTR